MLTYFSVDGSGGFIQRNTLWILQMHTWKSFDTKCTKTLDFCFFYIWKRADCSVLGGLILLFLLLHTRTCIVNGHAVKLSRCVFIFLIQRQTRSCFKCGCVLTKWEDFLGIFVVVMLFRVRVNPIREMFLGYSACLYVRLWEATVSVSTVRKRTGSSDGQRPGCAVNSQSVLLHVYNKLYAEQD